MNIYEEKTDFQINKAVAEHLGMRTDKNLLPAKTLDFGYNERYPATVWAGNPDEAWEQVCYTQEASDAWPIILNNKISINASVTSNNWEANHNLGFANWISASDENPLRAAMIVYLMMQDDK